MNRPVAEQTAGHAQLRRLALVMVAVVIAASISLLLGAVAPGRASARVVPTCPVPEDQVGSTGGLAVCVDRGDGSTYAAGDQITTCVTANIPQIAIYPPPPPPTIRVVNLASDGASHLLLEGQFASGQQCVAGLIAEPFGQETIRAEAVGSDGTVFIEDTVTFTTVSR
jgi:hypothetical protein